MTTLGKVALWLAVLLLVGGQLVGAGPSRDDTKPPADRKEEREVGVHADSRPTQRISITKFESATNRRCQDSFGVVIVKADRKGGDDVQQGED
jgi:hypothetical protein